ncbi:MAG: hypothetical protein IKT81_01910, partial [Clostridia bacterium]|nr:hypothetical protein [Clostridia bacterium]
MNVGNSIGESFVIKSRNLSAKLKLTAAHFNHHLRGAESDRDEAFVRDFCAGYGIELAVGAGT